MLRLALFCLLFCALGFGQVSPEVKAQADAVHRAAIVIDTHADTPVRFVDEGYDLAGPRGHGYLDLAAIRTGNLGAEFFSIWVDPRKYKDKPAMRALDMIDSVYQQAQKHPDEMMMAFSAEDIRRAHAQHKLAALMGVEGGHAIENDVRVLRDFYRLGVRYMTLTWMNTNEWADSSGDVNDSNVQHHNGLTEFGIEVVHEMNRLGMMVDISHVSDKTFWDTIEVSKAPVIASHSSARALTNHFRNMTDDMLKAVARNGGVVQVNFFSAFVDENYRKAYEAAEAANEKYKNADAATRAIEHQRAGEKEAAKIPRPPLKSLVDHIDHVAKVAGIDHVGMGSDFDGITSSPESMDSAADLPKLTEMLMARGYTADDMRKILGGNLLRVFDEVEKVSKKLQSSQ